MQIHLLMNMSNANPFTHTHTHKEIHLLILYSVTMSNLPPRPRLYVRYTTVGTRFRLTLRTTLLGRFCGESVRLSEADLSITQYANSLVAAQTSISFVPRVSGSRVGLRLSQGLSKNSFHFISTHRREPMAPKKNAVVGKGTRNAEAN